MKTTTILIMQGIAVTLQIINAGIGSVLPHTPTAAFVILCVAAVVGGFQFIVQHIGNQTRPDGALPDPPKTH